MNFNYKLSTKNILILLGHVIGIIVFTVYEGLMGLLSALIIIAIEIVIIRVKKNKSNDNFNENKYNRKINNEINLFCSKYDLTSVASILSISVPNFKKSTETFSVVSTPEQILQRKATEYKKNNEMDLAIACLKKSNEFMKVSWYSYQPKNYLRVVEFMKQDGKFDEARLEEEKINKSFEKSTNTVEHCLSGYYDKKSLYYKSDLLESSDSSFVCEECAKYRKRIFSEFGYDKRYPKLPDYFKQDLEEHEHCCISFFPVLHDISSPSWNFKGNLIKFCNRPFVDDRTVREKEIFEESVKEIEQENLDRINYDLLREHLPEIAPKSFGGYRKMKSSNSKNFIALQEKAALKQINL